jgi:hypothetical protein
MISDGISVITGLVDFTTLYFYLYSNNADM